MKGIRRTGQAIVRHPGGKLGIGGRLGAVELILSSLWSLRSLWLTRLLPIRVLGAIRGHPSVPLRGPRRRNEDGAGGRVGAQGERAHHEAPVGAGQPKDGPVGIHGSVPSEWKRLAEDPIPDAELWHRPGLRPLVFLSLRGVVGLRRRAQVFEDRKIGDRKMGTGGRQNPACLWAVVVLLLTARVEWSTVARASQAIAGWFCGPPNGRQPKRQTNSTGIALHVYSTILAGKAGGDFLEVH